MANLYTKLAGAAGRLATGAENAIMPAPADGLFTPEDIASARREGLTRFGLSLLGDTSGLGLGHALEQGVGAADTAYKGAQQDTLNENALARQKQILANRAAIGQQFAPQPGDTPDVILKRLPLMYNAYLKSGDLEAAKNLEPIIQHMILKQSTDKLQAVQLGDRVMTFDPQTGQYTPGPERHMNADELQQKEADRAVREEQIAASREARRTSELQRQMMMGQSAGLAFTRQNADLLKTEQAYGAWRGALESARTGNPAAYKSAMINFANVADPRSQIRMGVLQYLSQIDPSVKGRTDLALNKLLNGEYPARILDEMAQHVDDIHKNTVKLYESRRAGRVKANPLLDQFIAPTSEAFPQGSTLLAPATPVVPTATPKSNSRISQFLAH